jgi:hypothetical protein
MKKYNLQVLNNSSIKYWDNPYTIIISRFSAHQEVIWIRDNLVNIFYRNNKTRYLLKKFTFSIVEDSVISDFGLEEVHLLILNDILLKSDMIKIKDVLDKYFDTV